MAVEKVTFTLPEELVRRFKKIPAGKRSTFVKVAVERELDREAAISFLRRMKRKRVWKEKHHPNLRAPNDFAKYRPLKSRLTG